MHELLTRDDLDSVRIKKVAESILNATQQSVVPPGKTIRSQIVGDDFVLPLAKATSMALVLNELIQNAVEHGFKTLNDGRIQIQMSETETEYRVAVLNDGEPLAPDFRYDSSTSLGLSIVETLVRGDLQGTFTLENAIYDTGIIAIVIFPK